MNTTQNKTQDPTQIVMGQMVTSTGSVTGTPEARQSAGGCGSGGCGCGAGATHSTTKEQPGQDRLDITLLYLDLEVCSRCKETDTRLDQALDQVARVLEATGKEVSLEKIHIESLEMARQYRFVSSPTIRINERDIEMEVKENHCGSCSAIAGTDVACRVWSYAGQEYPAPPRALIVDAILRAAYADPSSETETPAFEDVPANIQEFFAAQASHVSQPASATQTAPASCSL
jgi:hypothetical protein